MTATRLSGWCSPGPPGTIHSQSQHRLCASETCGCEDFGGHRNTPQTPVVERDSVLAVPGNAGRMWDNRDGPSRAVSATRPGPDLLPFDSNERG